MGVHLPEKSADGISESAGNGDGHAAQLPAVEKQNDDSHSHVPVHYLPRTSRSVIVFTAIVAVGLLAVFLVAHHSRSTASQGLQTDATEAAEQPIPIDVVRVEHATGDAPLNLPGDARSFYETTIFGRTSGYVSKWFVDIGDQVKENQVLATIETPELDDQLHETKANFAELQAQANVAATNARFAKVSFDRWEAAAPEGAVSQQERDEKKAELDSAVAKLDAAKAAVNLGQAQVQRLETLEKFKKVVAPFDGVITERFLDIGSLVTAGSTTNTTPLYTISQSNQIRILVDVPQPAIGAIHVGMHARATVRELPGEIFVGTVDRTASAIDPRSRTLKVEVLAPNPNLTLLPGMYVQVAFETSRRNTPLCVPAAALIFGPDGPEVAVVGDDHRLTFHSVTIGKDRGDIVEIGSGLSENEMVGLNVGSQVAGGEQVEAHIVEHASHPAPAKVVPPGPAAPVSPTAAADRKG
ncbi:MAG TPA: efflux RND transporter periplasmic adaptor subunit [Tepidisphaeraceae bacterium]|jgi:RND family efflux transporter MFP subunit|nr:efflux RND transporter periplasmic adaptor subunit [Tepidisphaeraceae bacterium]